MKIGPNSYYGAAFDARENGGTITIGDYCSIADCVTILAGGEHRTDFVSTYPFAVKMGVGWHNEVEAADVWIGSDVWIGTHVTILSGVTIGHGAVIGANAVVVNDIPPYAVAVGVPARVKRYRFDPVTIERLLAVAWWDWSKAEVQRKAHLLTSTNIEGFLADAERRLRVVG